MYNLANYLSQFLSRTPCGRSNSNEFSYKIASCSTNPFSESIHAFEKSTLFHFFD